MDSVRSPYQKMVYSTVTHIIFDMDGLILDSERLYTEAFNRVVGAYGKRYSLDLRAQLMGKQTRECAETLVQALKLPISVDQFIIEIQKETDTLFVNVSLMPGAKRLIQHLHKKNVPFALATNSSLENADLKIKGHERLFDLFSHKVFGTSDPEVKKGKPSPDIFLVCASKFPDRPSPEKCLVFEDAPNGVKAGVSAGMQVVMVPDQELDRSLTSEATVVLSSLEDFKPEDFGLPPFEN